jgi:hypothetical protein
MKFYTDTIQYLSQLIQTIKYPTIYTAFFGIFIYIFGTFVYGYWIHSKYYAKYTDNMNTNMSSAMFLKYLMTYLRSIHPAMYRIKLPRVEKQPNSSTSQTARVSVAYTMSLKQFKEEYTKNLREPRVDEYKILIDKTIRANKLLSECKLYILRDIPWRFIISSAFLEFGYPFTIGDTIIIPEHKVKNIDVETLIHEKIHIYQRMQPIRFDYLYEHLFSFVKKTDPKLIVIPDEIRMSEMTNPDENGDIWIYYDKGTWYYPSLQLGMSRLTEEVGYPVQHYTYPMRVRTSGKKLLRSLSILNGYPSTISVYHPNEIFACLLSHQVVTDKKISKSIVRILNQEDI